MPANDPAVRIELARLAGRARVAKADLAEMTRTRAAGGTAANSPASLARRIVKAWPALSRAERAEVREILAPIMPKRG